ARHTQRSRDGRRPGYGARIAGGDALAGHPRSLGRRRGLSHGRWSTALPAHQRQLSQLGISQGTSREGGAPGGGGAARGGGGDGSRRPLRARRACDHRLALSFSRQADSQGLSFFSDGDLHREDEPSARRGNYRVQVAADRGSARSHIVRERARSAAASGGDGGRRTGGARMTAAPQGVVVAYAPREAVRARVRSALARAHRRGVLARTHKDFSGAFRTHFVDTALVEIAADGDGHESAELARDYPSVPFLALTPFRPVDAPA